jgi:hypothetical protein
VPHRRPHEHDGPAPSGAQGTAPSGAQGTAPSGAGGGTTGGDPGAVGAVAGGWMLRASWAAAAVLAVGAVGAVVTAGPLRLAYVVASLVLFAGGGVAYLAGYAVAVRRSRFEDVSMGGLVFLSGSAPAAVRRSLLWATTAQVVVGLLAASLRPFTSVAFGVLGCMAGLGLQALWAARHGTFPPRPPRRGAERGG